MERRIYSKMKLIGRRKERKLGERAGAKAEAKRISKRGGEAKATEEKNALKTESENEGDDDCTSIVYIDISIDLM